ncbi:TPA: kringle-containing transmembrane protein 1-like [Bos taurus]|nr:TPA: kringle-containing transmembrane protein 1-like [Bos taurus]
MGEIQPFSDAPRTRRPFSSGPSATPPAGALSASVPQTLSSGSSATPLGRGGPAPQDPRRPRPAPSLPQCLRPFLRLLSDAPAPGREVSPLRTRDALRLLSDAPPGREVSPLWTSHPQPSPLGRLAPLGDAAPPPPQTPQRHPGPGRPPPAPQRRPPAPFPPTSAGPAPPGSSTGAERRREPAPGPSARVCALLAQLCNLRLVRSRVDLPALLVEADLGPETTGSALPAQCFTANGADYRGTQNWTALQGGKPCLFWNETFQHPYNTLKYPNGEGGVGEHNYCRNPDGDVSPWCYVAEHEDGVYWKYCEIPTCQMPGNLGCYKDHGNPPPLTGTSKTSNKLTIQNCISFCRSQRFKFAGIESGYACFCGNDPDYWKYGEAASTECSSVCFGDHTQPCGGDGRVIVFDTLVGACGGNYSAMTSVVYSPDFPDAYAAGRVCYWTIRVPGAAHIQFNFTLFDIRDSADMVELLDGYTHRVLVRFNGRNRPPSSFNISLDFIILYFFSDRINQAQGFAVLYQAIKEDPPQEKPTDNQMLAEVITEQANFSVSAARSSKVLYVITTSPSHPRQTVPGWTVYGLATLLILTVTAIVAKILLHITFRSHRVPASGDLRDCHQPGTSGEIWSIFYEPSTSISIFKKKLKCQSQPDDRNPLVSD